VTSFTVKCPCSLRPIYYGDVSLVVSVLDQRPRSRGFESRWLWPVGGRIATVGQLLLAPWALAYSTLHPLEIGK